MESETSNSPMRASRHQHIDIHLPRQSCEHLPISGRHDLLPMRDTYPQRLVRDREGERVVRVLQSARPPCETHLGLCGSEEDVWPRRSIVAKSNISSPSQRLYTRQKGYEIDIDPLAAAIASVKTHLVELSPYDVHFRRDRAQIVIRLLVADIASTQNLADLAWNLDVSSSLCA